VSDSISGDGQAQLSVPLALRETDPDLALVVAAWPELPAAIKAAVMALVRSAAAAE
jgi:hypothetical protein